MKNDYKIGLVIGLLVLFLGVGYFIFRGPGKPKKPQTPASTETSTGETAFAGETTSTGSSGDDEFSSFAPPSGGTTETTVTASTETVAPAPAAPAETTLTDRVEGWSTRSGNNTGGVTTEAAAPAAGETLSPRLAENDTITIPPVAPAAPPATAGDTGNISLPPIEPRGTETTETVVTVVEPVTSASATIYTVKANDVAWCIAEEHYGKGMGKYWTLIRDANPNVNISELKTGQKLTIPPLPENARQRMRDNASAGNAFTDAAGRKIYVTKSGDRMWTIAQEMYGKNKGHLYTEIQKANPNVNPRYLRPGLRLVIPEVQSTTTDTAAGGELATYGTETVTAVFATSNDYYTVQSGDSLWKIAQKQYGNGAYADVIKRANPNIDADNLKVGQKLVIPPKPAGASTGSTTSGGSDSSGSTTTTPSGTVSDDEPDFGL